MSRRAKAAARSLALVDAAGTILEEINPATVRAVCYRLFVDRVIESMAKNETKRVSAAHPADSSITQRNTGSWLGPSTGSWSSPPARHLCHKTPAVRKGKSSSVRSRSTVVGPVRKRLRDPCQRPTQHPMHPAI